ncbi:DddA-like double-stranded DNA deaminase toxin [Streptomyces shenzhenensis]|uniref:DddA-like double-stranded DNA deaminase toxin n=1 Tax=Streptomyces shenzhenensis TaxID=943815 RepID=UPI0033F26DAB
MEAKHAAWMKNNGIAHAAVVVNKNIGACKDELDCENSVEASLPVDRTLKVCYPGAGSPVTLFGERVNP